MVKRLNVFLQNMVYGKIKFHKKIVYI